MSLPINPFVVRRSAELRESFRSPDPLPKFMIIPNFLRRSLARDVLAGCERARYFTYCAYQPPGSDDLQYEFREPESGPAYLSIHQRARRSIPEIDDLSERFSTTEAIEAVSALTGLKLSTVHRPTVLTCWGPQSFIGPHTDYTPGHAPRLVLSISLTRGWRRSYGGSTFFAWSGADRVVRLQPRLNTAMLFVPTARSVHWVERVAMSAPPKRRFTWIAYFG